MSIWKNFIFFCIAFFGIVAAIYLLKGELLAGFIFGSLEYLCFYEDQQEDKQRGAKSGN